MKIIVILSIVFVIAFNSCSGSESENNVSLKKGTYSFVLSDSSGNSLVEGKMVLDTINLQKDSRDYIVKGSYTISKMTTDTSYHGFATMNQGPLSGYYYESTKLVNINTNPKMADANVFINAYLKGTAIDGGWYYSTFRGMNKEGGLFKASKDKK